MSNKLVNLKDGEDYLIPKVFPSIDWNNVIASGKSTGFTATQDCFVSTQTFYNSNGGIKIDGKQYSINPGYGWTTFILRQGQSYTNYGDDQLYKRQYYVYGIKYI